ncbi:3-deoxy-D-manno-octulosonic acid transferase [Roseivivax halodurans JCM 10272]|uniref:3-deoxy-D-manno-octulosonic acid transferase n=1 Tax=Roseivivax halodurans JCM 10272 TaxID=1449350 RepID=X7EH73_9RHOB|nr:glycosyltransferase N-terminal domain-containing protein [Roseivivax halodurans]ETX14458.1 3-deoxy-D-manno-octulosonic acid transferase [Roseivivax halodurans JCM 10272]
MLIYRILIRLFAAGVLIRLALRGQKDAITARFGYGPNSNSPHIWLHAASNGELASAKPIISAWREARPDLPLVVTCNSDTGVALAREMGLEAALAPLDLPGAVDRFCARWRVQGHIAMESELWPHRFIQMPGPVAVLGGRLSSGSARTWSRFPRLAARVFGRIDYASAQDAGSLDRMAALGLAPEARGPVADLKSFYERPDIAPDPSLAAAFDRQHTWLAASTHEGEEAVVAEAHVLAREGRPDLRLILAPRHPRRADEIAALLGARGLTVSRRSAGDDPAQGDVYLADTLGEMPLWYQLAGTVFIGGTLTDRGGHTPYEPASFDAALIHGPDTRNFRAPFAALGDAAAAIRITDASSLAAAVTDLAPAEHRERVAQAARNSLRPEAGAGALSDALLSLFGKNTTPP